MTRFTGFRPKVDIGQVSATLAKREQQARTAALAAIGGGVALSMIGPLIVYGVVCLVAMKYRQPIPGWLGFAGITAVALPLTVLIGYFYQGGTTAELAEEMDWDSPFAGRAAGRAMAGAAMAEMVLMMASLAGYGIRRLSALGKLRSVNRGRAAEVLAALARGESGQSFNAIMAEGESWDEFRKVVDYLLFFDWVGVSQKRRLLWISTEAKEKILGRGDAR